MSPAFFVDLRGGITSGACRDLRAQKAGFLEHDDFTFQLLLIGKGRWKPPADFGPARPRDMVPFFWEPLKIHRTENRRNLFRHTLQKPFA